jgi:hypothetical protein
MGDEMSDKELVVARMQMEIDTLHAQLDGVMWAAEQHLGTVKAQEAIIQRLNKEAVEKCGAHMSGFQPISFISDSVTEHDRDGNLTRHAVSRGRALTENELNAPVVPWTARIKPCGAVQGGHQGGGPVCGKDWYGSVHFCATCRETAMQFEIADWRMAQPIADVSAPTDERAAFEREFRRIGNIKEGADLTYVFGHAWAWEWWQKGVPRAEHEQLLPR